MAVKRLLSTAVVGLVLGTLGLVQAEGGQTPGRSDRGPIDPRTQSPEALIDKARPFDWYFRDRDIALIREYYRPLYRPIPPSLQRTYTRAGYLPLGWARRMRPLPPHVERALIPIPATLRRGILDNWVVVYNERGFIIDVARLF